VRSIASTVASSPGDPREARLGVSHLDRMLARPGARLPRGRATRFDLPRVATNDVEPGERLRRAETICGPLGSWRRRLPTSNGGSLTEQHRSCGGLEVLTVDSFHRSRWSAVKCVSTGRSPRGRNGSSDNHRL
jgi:hypothetical protein